MQKNHNRPPTQKQPPGGGMSAWEPRAVIALALTGAVIAKFLLVEGITSAELWAVVQPAFWVGIIYYLVPSKEGKG